LASALGSLLVSPFVSAGAVALALAAEEDAAAAVLLPRGLVDGEPFAFAGGAGGAAAAGSDDFAFSVFEGEEASAGGAASAALGAASGLTAVSVDGLGASVSEGCAPTDCGFSRSFAKVPSLPGHFRPRSA
jgi:hypothetical protein